MTTAGPEHTRTRASVWREVARAFFARFPRVKAMLVLTAAVLALNVPTVRVASEVSKLDEREHIDHLVRGSQGEIGRHREVLRQETLRELCRRGSEIHAYPPCSAGELDATEFAIGGGNIAPPGSVYYLPTGLTARFLRALPVGGDSLVSWGRLLGSVWLLGGFYLALRIGDLLRLDRRVVAVALVMAAAIPTQLHAATAINPDVSAFAAGAVVLLAALVWERGSKGVWVLGVAAAVAMLLDDSNGVGVLVALLYLGCRGLARRLGRTDEDRRTTSQYCLALVVTLVIAVVSVAGWSALRDVVQDPIPQADRISFADATDEERARLDPTRERLDVDHLRIETIANARELFAMFPPVVDVAPPDRRLSTFEAVWYRVFERAVLFVLVGVILAVVFRATLRDRVSALGIATLTGLLVAPVLIHLYNWFEYGYFEPTVPRFGLSALPVVVLLAAAMARRPVARAVLVALTGGLYLTALTTLL